MKKCKNEREKGNGNEREKVREREKDCVLNGNVVYSFRGRHHPQAGRNHHCEFNVI